MHANQCQIELGAKCMEITREPVASNASELLPKGNIIGVTPVYSPSAVNYRFNVMTVIRIVLDNGDYTDIELQEVTNQATWSTGNLAGLNQAIADINAWFSSSGGSAPYPIISGGTITQNGNYRRHTFTSSDELVVSYVPSNFNNTAKILLVPAGGGGGGQNGGSGGAGGYPVEILDYVLRTGTFNVNVGTKGIGATGLTPATAGGNTSFDGYVARGGAQGQNGGNGIAGQTPGGSSTRGLPPGDGIEGSYQGGGSSGSGILGTGGGAGGGGNGQSGTNLINGAGGIGWVSAITGQTYSGGGGGGCTDGLGTPGSGTNGGGNGGNVTGSNATIAGSGGGGGGTNGGDGYDGLFIIEYPFQVELNPYEPPTIEINKLIFDWSGAYPRWDQACPLLLQDGTYLLGVGRYSDSQDYGASNIVFYSSTDGDNWTYISSIGNLGNHSSYIPNLQQRTDGTVVCVFLNIISGTYGRICQKTSNDNGATWSATTVVRQNVNEQLDMAPRRIFITPTGRWLVPFGVGQFVVIPYSGDGYTLYSDDEGATWSTSADVIVSPDNNCYERGFYLDLNGDIVTYWRSGSTAVYGATSEDDGETWGTPVNLLMNASTSTTTAFKLPSGLYIAIMNGGTRKVLKIKKSTDGYGDGLEWENVLEVQNQSTKHSIEPSDPMVIGSNLFFYFSLSDDATLEKFDLYRAKIPLSSLI